MDRPCLINRLRIASATVCGAIVVLLGVWWARSYHTIDIVGVTKNFAVVSGPGAIGFDTNAKHERWSTLATDTFMAIPQAKSEWPSRVWGKFHVTNSPSYKCVAIPYWFAILLTTAATIV